MIGALLCNRAQLSAVHSARSAPGRVLRLTVEIPTDFGPLGVTIVQATRASDGAKFFIAAVDDDSFAAQYDYCIYVYAVSQKTVLK